MYIRNDFLLGREGWEGGREGWKEEEDQ